MSGVQTRAKARQPLSLRRWLRPEKVKATSRWIKTEAMRASHLCAAVDGCKSWESSSRIKAKTLKINHRVLRSNELWCRWLVSKWRWPSAVVTPMECPGWVSMHLANCWSREDFELLRALSICDTTFHERTIIQKLDVYCKWNVWGKHSPKLAKKSMTGLSKVWLQIDDSD